MPEIAVRLPELGEGVNEGELVKWLVRVGDTIVPDQAVAEIMTDKATVEVPSNFGGIVKSLHFKPGDTVIVEKTLITLDGAAGQSAGKVHHDPASTTPAMASVSSNHGAIVSALASPAASNTPLAPASARVLASPATRKAARELGVDINQVLGTGPVGRVLLTDLQSSGTASNIAYTNGAGRSHEKTPIGEAVNATDERVPMIGMRKKIATAMQNSKHIVPHFTLMDEANVTSLVALRDSIKDKTGGIKVTYLPFIVKALIASLRQYPMLNASIDDAASEIIYKKSFHIGFAADTPQGLVVPVIKNADQKSLLEISGEINDLAIKARDNKLKVEDMKGATITITNIGTVAGMSATPIINHPEVAIIGMYRIYEKLALIEGNLQALKMMNLTVTADHRLVDGARAAQFLKALIERVENPARLMLEMA